MYMKTLLVLVAESNNQPAVENIQQQLDVLIDKKGKGGRLTLKKY